MTRLQTNLVSAETSTMGDISLLANASMEALTLHIAEDGSYEDSNFYFVDVIFLVENGFFKVPRHYFEDSAIFRDMFELPVSPNSKPDGLSKKQPIKLEGIRKYEFRQLLRVMYPKEIGRVDNLNLPEWTAVLDLATMWEFKQIRNIAIRRLSTFKMEATEKIRLATNYRVRGWLLPALNELARRDRPMTKQDADRLGVDCVLKIASIRERYPSLAAAAVGSVKTNGRPSSIPSRESFDYTEILRKEFQEELKQIDVEDL